jgi:dipeptidyl aminopeptidase/acylaminoacyl peptidase
MTTPERLERNLPSILGDLAMGSTPDYIDDVLATTAHQRQRPAWTFPERWLPMADITTRQAVAPRVPFRAIGMALVILALLVAAALVYVGSHQTRLPAPFGPAANGLIPYVSGGNLYVGDPSTGATRLIVDAPEDIGVPQFSPDGTRVAFLQTAKAAGRDPVDVYVVRADGSGLQRITRSALPDWRFITWTPDGQDIAVAYPAEYSGDGCATTFCFADRLDLLDATGNGSVVTLANATRIDSIGFRPPDGREILIRGNVNGSYGLYAENADGTNLHTLLRSSDPGNDDFWGGSAYGADGNQIFYTRPYEVASAAGTCCDLWVMSADGSDPHRFIANDGTAWNGQPVVSPDGTRVAFWNGSITVVRADGTGLSIETGPKLTGTAHWVWSPDSSKILMFPNDVTGSKAYLLDPAGGAWTTVPWTSDGDLDWQRLAPG